MAEGLRKRWLWVAERRSNDGKRSPWLETQINPNPDLVEKAADKGRGGGGGGGVGGDG